MPNARKTEHKKIRRQYHESQLLRANALMKQLESEYGRTEGSGRYSLIVSLSFFAQDGSFAGWIKLLTLKSDSRKELFDKRAKLPPDIVRDAKIEIFDSLVRQ
jgi:hypothetical protein